MRSNMIKVEIMPVSVIIAFTIFAFICAFIGNWLIIKGIYELKEVEKNNINYVLQDK